MTNINSRVLSSLFLAAGIFVGCGSDGESKQVGSLELQLQSQGSQGTFFGLRGTFALSDPEGLQVTSSELDQGSVLTLSPQVGSYQLELCAQGSTNPVCQGVSGYGLYRLECQGGMFPPDQCVAQGFALTATLVSGATLNTPNPQTVSITENQATTASFAFTVPGEGSIIFARGTLNIDLDVTQGFPVGQACAAAVECQSKVCSGTPPVCQAASCNDGVQNGGETKPDCGGPCAACACMSDADCATGQVCDVTTLQCTGGGSECMADDECPSGQCVNGSCL